MNHDTVEILRKGREDLILEAMRKAYDIFALIDSCAVEGEKTWDTAERICGEYKAANLGGR